jgi:hypothetical protein
MEEQLFEVAERQSTTSTGDFAAFTRKCNSHASAHCTLQEQRLYPYHVQPVQECHTMHSQDMHCQWILQQSTEDPTFTAKVIFTDESFYWNWNHQHSQRTCVVR